MGRALNKYIMQIRVKVIKVAKLIKKVEYVLIEVFEYTQLDSRAMKNN